MFVLVMEVFTFHLTFVVTKFRMYVVLDTSNAGAAVEQSITHCPIYVIYMRTETDK